MRLTGDRAAACLSHVLSRSAGAAPLFAPPGTPPALTIDLRIDPDALAPRFDLRAGTREAGAIADLDVGPAEPILRRSLSRVGACEADLPTLGRLVLSAWRAYRALEAVALRAQAALLEGAAAFGECAIWLDERALFRHPDLDPLATDTLERRLARGGIDYVELDGDVGLLCIGAGMTLAMIDRLCDAGARPAAFVDVSRNPSAEGIALALEAILDHRGARIVAVNAFGGITPMDRLAEAIVEALARRGGAGVPIVVRLEGTGGEAGRAALAAAGIPLAAATADVVAFAARHAGGGTG